MSAGAQRFRLRRSADGGVMLELGRAPVPGDDGLPVDPAGFVALKRLQLSEAAAWQLVDGLSAALGLPLPDLPAEPLPDRSPQALPATAPTAPMVPMVQPPPPPSPPSHSAGAAPRVAPDTPAAHWAQRLREAVQRLVPDPVEERSLRLSPGRVQAHRFLLSVGGARLAGGRAGLPAAALQLAEALGWPAHQQPALRSLFETADHLHAGFEADGEQATLKLYAEYELDGLRAAQARLDGAPLLQFAALKWRPQAGPDWRGDSGPVLRTDYHALPGHDGQACAELAQGLLGEAPDELRRAVVQALLQASRRLPPGPLPLLRVSEPGQPRQSFDLRLYDAQMQVGELQPLLQVLGRVLDLPGPAFDALCGQMLTRRLGHLAAGLHRDGQPFVSLYFGGQRRRLE